MTPEDEALWNRIARRPAPAPVRPPETPASAPDPEPYVPPASCALRAAVVALLCASAAGVGYLAVVILGSLLGGAR